MKISEFLRNFVFRHLRKRADEATDGAPRLAVKPRSKPTSDGQSALSSGYSGVKNWFLQLLPSTKVPSKENSAEQSTVQLVQIEGKSFIFGLEWRLIPPTRALIRTISLARNEGKSMYVISEMEDIIGLGVGNRLRRGPKFSAALHLASKFSQGGLELYAFELSNLQVAVVALNESRPIPGFDYVGDSTNARNLIDEFLAIQSGQMIRQVGNAGLLEAEESVSVEDIFDFPVRAARIRALSNGRSTRWLLYLCGLIVLSVAAGLYWLEYERKEFIQASRQNAETVDVIYRRSLTAALRNLPSAGHARFESWLKVINDLPLAHKGWRLVRVECVGSECKAQWDRVYGNFSDFMNAVPPHTKRSEEVQVKDNPVKASILTWHALDEQPEKIVRIDPENLPKMQAGLRELSDRLQDLSLLGQAQTQVDKPSLFGDGPGPEQIENPIFKGGWSLSHELWILRYLIIPDHCVAQSLELELFNHKGEENRVFKAKGDYYVRS